MKLLVRYLLKEICVPLVVWVAFLFLLLFVMSFLRGTDVLLGSAVTPGDLGRFTLYLAPHFLQQALPIAFLLAILLGLGRLSEDHELTALQAVGVSPLQILLGPLAIGVVIGATMLFMAFTAEPWGLRAVKNAVNEIIKKNLAGDVKSGVFYDDLSDLTLYAETVDPNTGAWKNVLVHDDRERSSPLLVLARNGKVNPSLQGEDLKLQLEDGDVHRANRTTSEYTAITFERGELVVGVGDSFFNRNKFRRPKEELTPTELLAAASDPATPPKEATGFLMTYHWRWGQALMPLAFALMGTPLAMSRRQGGRARGYVLTIAGYILYYVLARVCVSFGEQGRLDVRLAGQLPNVIFAVLGGWAMLRTTRAGSVR